MKLINKLDDKFEEYILVTSLAFNVGLIFIQVAMRYIFSSSLSWSEELARYIFIWQTWLGTSLAVKYDKHIRVDVLKNFLSFSKQKKLDNIIRIIWIIFIAYLAYQGFKLTSMQFARNQLSPALEIPLGFAYASMPIGCCFMIFRLIQKIYREKISESKED